MGLNHISAARGRNLRPAYENSRRTAKPSKVPAAESDEGDVDKLCELFRVLGNSLDLEETLATVDRELGRLVDYDAISVHVEEGGRLVPAYAAGAGFAALASLECRPGEGFLGLAAAGGGPVLNCRPARLDGLGAALVIPLDNGGAVTAVLALYHEGARIFSGEDLAIARAAAPKLAAAIGNARAYQAAAGLAGTDRLTGALNARAMFQRLDAELARTGRLGQPLAVAHCSLEGVDESDPVLAARIRRQVAAALRACCREYDAVACTGDDFVLILAGMSPPDFAEKRRRIESSVEAAGMTAGLPLAARIGASFFPGDGADAEGLLAAAAERWRAARPETSGCGDAG
jgi:GGDEF domain-containing protein